MKKAIIYVIIAIFLALVVQPSIVVEIAESKRVPTNTETTVATNDTVDLKTSKSNATICINPAFGGYNTGYSEKGKMPAKDITLELALEIGKKLELSGYNVVYTRDSDNILTFNNVQEDALNRINLAKDQKADYLFTIELNSDTDSLAKGYTIFTQPNPGLIELANNIAQQFDQINYSEFKGLDSDHYGNFPILDDSDLPSLFVEFGYITNPSDYSQITNKEYQEKLASAIAKAFLEEID